MKAKAIARRNRNGGMVERNSVSGVIVDTIVILVLIFVVLICIMPLWHVLMASFSDGQTLMANKSLLLLPIGEWTTKGYAHVFANTGIMRGYLNTIIYVVGATLIGLVLNVMGGYCLSRKTKLKNTLTLLLMFTMMFSGGLIPTYMVVRSLGLVGNMGSILIPGCTNAFFVIMTKNAFESVPETVVEAARIDGAGHFRVMFRICLPQCMSLVTVVILYSVVNQWNSWFPAAIYLTNSKELWPLQLHMKEMIGTNKDFLNNANPDYSRYLIQYALIIVATLPILLAFPFFQKFIEKGALIGGVKE